MISPSKNDFNCPVPISFYAFSLWNLTLALRFDYISFSSVPHPQKKKKKKRRDLVKANKSKLHFFISLFYYHHFFGNKIDIFLNIPIFPSKLYIFLKFITFSLFLGREFDLFQEREIGLQWIYGTFFFKDLKKEIAKMFHVEMIINKIYYMKNHRRA